MRIGAKAKWGESVAMDRVMAMDHVKAKDGHESPMIGTRGLRMVVDTEGTRAVLCRIGPPPATSVEGAVPWSSIEPRGVKERDGAGEGGEGRRFVARWMKARQFLAPVWAGGGFLVFLGLWAMQAPAEASCGSASCFVVISSQQAVSPAGVLTVNINFTHTPNEIPPEGANTIPFANQQTKELTLANSQVNQLSTLVQTATLDLNYGLTERIGLQLQVPYRMIDAVGQIGTGAVSNTWDRGFGDLLGKVKYNMLPTLRSMVVLEMGVWFPIGDYGHQAVANQLAESTLQVGRGAFGFQPGFYQTYEIISHRLNQFFSGSYRYTMRNSDGYRFGHEVSLNAGLNLVTFPWLTLTNQINFRYKGKDNIEAALYELRPAPLNRRVVLDSNVIGRDVPTTDSTLVAFSTGLVINAFDVGQVYFIAQIPIYRDFNGNLQQEIGFVGGVSKAFVTPPLASLFAGSAQ